MMEGVNLDLYDDLSDMIACDMRSDFDTVDLTPLSAADLGEYISDPSLDHQLGTNVIHSTLPGSNTPPNSTGDSYHTMEADMGTDSTHNWFQNNPQLFTVNNSDFEQTGGGLMVNPQTGVPISRSQTVLPSISTVTTSSSIFMSTPPPDGMTNIMHSMNSDNKKNNGGIRISDVSSMHPHTMVVGNQQHAKSNAHRKHGKEISVIDPQEKVYPKPTYSYSCLIAMALKNSKNGSLPVSEIYSFMTENFPYFKTAPNGWKNSVRHNLSLNKCFEKIEKPGTGTQRKGCLWAMNPAKIEKMDEEVQKWKRKDPVAIRESMANPDILERLERGEVKSSSPKAEEITADSTTEGCLSPDTTPGTDLEYTKSEESIPPLPDLIIQNGFWEELNNTNMAMHQGVSIKNEVTTSSSTHQLDQILNHSSNISSSSSPHHSLVSSSTSDLQGNYAYSNMPSMTSSVDNAGHHTIKQKADTWSDDNNKQSNQESPALKCEDENQNGNLLDTQSDSNTLFNQTNSRPVSALI